jgi:hypothetical protein
VVQRSLLPFHESSEHRGQFTSRQDVRVVHQTSWADGSFWNKPLISQASISSYNTSTGMDLVSVPGDLFASPDIETPSAGNISNQPFAFALAPDEVYVMGATGASSKLATWDGTSWGQTSNSFSGGAGNDPVGMCYHAGLNTVFALFEDGDVRYITLDSAGGLVRDVGTIYHGANIFVHFGRLMVWTGDILIEVTDPLGSDGQTTIYDDGNGPDYLENVAAATGPFDPLVFRTAVSSSEGVWIVKNVEQEGQPTPFLTRVDRTQDGTNIGVAMGTMQPGIVALDLQSHNGGVLLSTTPDVDALVRNEYASLGSPEIVIHHFQKTFGTVGSILGPNPSDSPYRFIGVDRDRVYLGGMMSAYAYDVVRGGLRS